MLIPEKNMGFIHTPKCGSTTTWRMICATYGEREKGLHLPASHFEEELDRELNWFVLIRNPIDRLVSALNHVNSHDPIERVMQQALREGSQKVFWPQSHWIDRPARFWPFEQMAEAFKAAGMTGPLKHENESAKRYTAADVEPWREGIEAFYAKDYTLRAAALKNPGALHDPQGKMVSPGREVDPPEGDRPDTGHRKRKSPSRRRRKPAQ